MPNACIRCFTIGCIICVMQGQNPLLDTMLLTADVFHKYTYSTERQARNYLYDTTDSNWPRSLMRVRRKCPACRLRLQSPGCTCFDTPSRRPPARPSSYRFGAFGVLANRSSLLVSRAAENEIDLTAAAAVGGGGGGGSNRSNHKCVAAREPTRK